MQIRKVVRIPTGGCGLSEPIDIRGYRIASIKIPKGWQTANLTFRGGTSAPERVTQVVPTGTGVGLGVDANAYDIQMGNAVTLQKNGSLYTPAKVDPIDISAVLSAAATISTSKFGVLWVFQKCTGTTEAGVCAVDPDTTTSAYTSAIQALAQYAVSTRALPPSDAYVPIGCVLVQEGGSGAFTWGTDSITAETETYYSFVGLPEVLIREDGTLALDAGAATFSYGAATVRLGTGTRVTLSGEVNVAVSGSNVATGKTGAWLLYALADNTIFPLQLGNAYGSLAGAQAAVANAKTNPLLACFGAMYVVNTSGGNFVPGTTHLDAAGISTTFETFGPRFEEVTDSDGTAVTVSAAEDKYVTLTAAEKEAVTRMGTIQLRSGTSATPVDQTGSPDLELLLESI